MYNFFTKSFRTLGSIVLAFLIVVGSLFTFNDNALAADSAHGKSIFTANCAACHSGGSNSINPSKTLKMADLEANGKNSVAAIVAQITNGNGAMPGFKGRLSDSDMEDVASYVLDQAENGW